MALAAAGVAAAQVARGADDVGPMIEAGWKVQQRWEALSRDGGFEYDFALRAWNGSNELKETLERVVRVENHEGRGQSETLLARKDGKDETSKIREEETRAQSRGSADRKTDELPSPFDPRYRERYAFELERPGEGPAALAFRPIRPFEHAIRGRGIYDAAGRLREVRFELDRNPLFTRDLRFAILFDEEGNPSRVDSSGEVSLVVWKRRFESGVTLRNFHLARLAPASTVSSTGP